MSVHNRQSYDGKKKNFFCLPEKGTQPGVNPIKLKILQNYKKKLLLCI